MEFLRKYMSQIKAQLTGLTLSQRLLIALLVVVMIATIFVTVQMSAKPDMVVLIPQSMTPEEINRAEMAIKGKYPYQISGDKILVPADKAYQIRGELGAAQALPRDTTQALAKLMEDNEYLRTEASNERRWNYARQETLAKILRGFPYLADAQVIISKGDRIGIGRPEVPSSAMVTVKVHNNDVLTSNQVLAIVDMVRGSVAGMKREDVHVTDGHRPYSAPSEGQQLPTTQLELKRTMEEDLTKKLLVMFSEFGAVKVAVNVVPDMSDKRSNSTTFDATPVKAEVSRTTEDVTTSDTTGGGGEPGVKSNTGSASLAPSAPRGTNSSQTKEQVTNQVGMGRTELVKSNMPGTEVTDLTASICLPRSYFVAIYRRNQKDPKADPDDATLGPIATDNIKRVRDQAKTAIGISSDEKIRVDWFDDTVIARVDDVAKNAAMAGSFGSIAQYAKPGILSILAIGALIMMLKMVKRAVPATAGAETDPSVFFGGGAGGGRRKGEPGQLDAGDDVFGEAGEGEAVLTGIELDDETLASRKMVDEVSTMIKENPENAATLVKRWIAKGK